MDLDGALQMNESSVAGFEVTVVFLCTFEKAASSVLQSGVWRAGISQGPREGNCSGQRKKRCKYG